MFSFSGFGKEREGKVKQTFQRENIHTFQDEVYNPEWLSFLKRSFFQMRKVGSIEAPKVRERREGGHRASYH